MNYFEDGGVSCSIMSSLAGVDKSTISRYINQNKIQHIPSSNSKRFKYDIHNVRRVLTEFVSSRYKIDPKKAIQCFYNFKGGTGKTTVGYQYATHLSLCGYKVLLVDADPQGHLTASLPLNFKDEKFHTLYDLLIDEIPYEDIIKPISEGLDCIPADLSLTRIEIELHHATKREEKLSDILQQIKKEQNYDLIVIDTNPSISMLNRNVVVASNIINIVTETAPYSLNGLRILQADLEKFFSNMKIKMPRLRIIANKYEDRSTTSAEGISLLHQYYGDELLREFAIRKSEDFVTASKLGAPLALFVKTNSNAFLDISELIQICLEEMKINKDEDLFTLQDKKHG